MKEGIIISVTDLHPKKKNISNIVIVDGIDISVSEEQPFKTPSPIDVTDSGIIICFNDSQ